MGYKCHTSVSALGIWGATSGRSVPHHASHAALTSHAHGLNTLPPVPPPFNASPRRGTRCADRTALVCRRAPPPPARGGGFLFAYAGPAGRELSPPQPPLGRRRLGRGPGDGGRPACPPPRRRR